MSIKNLWNSVKQHMHIRKPTLHNDTAALLPRLRAEIPPAAIPSAEAIRAVAVYVNNDKKLLAKIDDMHALPAGSTSRTFVQHVKTWAQAKAPAGPSPYTSTHSFLRVHSSHAATVNDNHGSSAGQSVL
jgi:hypothetical protein